MAVPRGRGATGLMEPGTRTCVRTVAERGGGRRLVALVT